MVRAPPIYLELLHELFDVALDGAMGLNSFFCKFLANRVVFQYQKVLLLWVRSAKYTCYLVVTMVKKTFWHPAILFQNNVRYKVLVTWCSSIFLSPKLENWSVEVLAWLETRGCKMVACEEDIKFVCRHINRDTWSGPYSFFCHDQPLNWVCLVQELFLFFLNDWMCRSLNLGFEG